LHGFLFLSEFFQKWALGTASDAETGTALKMPKHYIWCVAATQATTGSVARLNFMGRHPKCARSTKVLRFDRFFVRFEPCAGRANSNPAPKTHVFMGFSGHFAAANRMVAGFVGQPT
jgi:hypothetical protein